MRPDNEAVLKEEIGNQVELPPLPSSKWVCEGKKGLFPLWHRPFNGVWLGTYSTPFKHSCSYISPRQVLFAPQQSHWRGVKYLPWTMHLDKIQFTQVLGSQFSTSFNICIRASVTTSHLRCSPASSTAFKWIQFVPKTQYTVQLQTA